MEECCSRSIWMIKSKSFFRYFFVFLFILNLSFFGKVKSASVPATINYQGKILQSGTAVDGNLGMSFTIYDSLSGGSAVYTAFGTLPSVATSSVVVSSGLFDINLGSGSTNVLDSNIFANNSELYLEITVEGETLSPRKRLTAVPYAFNAKYLDGISATSTSITSTYIPVSDENGNFDFNSVTSTELNVTATTTAKNILPSTNALYNLGSSLFRWLKGWFVDLETTNLIATNATTTNLIVTNTANIESAVINSSTLTNSNIENLVATNVTTTNFYTSDMTVDGNICDASGNCFTPNEVNSLVSSSRSVYVTTTPYTIAGNFASSSYTGYRAGNYRCVQQFGSDYHMCTTDDILSIINFDNFDNFSTLSDAWISNGPPGYTVNANDCRGWTSNSGVGTYGGYWDFVTYATGGGEAKLTTCNLEKAISCCR